MFRHPHGWQIRSDEWAKFLQEFEMLQSTGVPNQSKAMGKQRYFLRIGGGTVHNQPYFQYTMKQLTKVHKPRN
jgi:hypothetical protein